jgi:hypothetical protein
MKFGEKIAMILSVKNSRYELDPIKGMAENKTLTAN